MTGAPADLDAYANNFDEIKVEQRESIIDLNAINPLSDFREYYQNASTEESEHKISTSADTDDTAYIETKEHGQYTAGYQVQTGVGIRIPSQPTGDSTIRWGYYEVDSNGDPLNGFYFGMDSDGIFVARARSGTVEKVYQSDWNGDTLDTNGKSGVDLDLSDGLVTQIEFIYYGYGSIEMQFLVSDADTKRGISSSLVTAHTFNVEGETSVENTNLPIRQEIASGGTSNDALDVFVGGRQFGIVGQRTTNSRENAHYLDELTGIDNAQWYPAISVKVKDGSDIGSIDFRHVLAGVLRWSGSNDNVPKRWQVRRGTELDQATWQSPSSAENEQDETCMKIDTTATTIDQGSGVTGRYMDGGVIASGNNQQRTVTAEQADGRITHEEIVTLCFKSQPGEGTGAMNAIYFNWTEEW